MGVSRWLSVAVVTALVAACSHGGPGRDGAASAAMAGDGVTSDEATAAAIAPDPRVGAVFLGGRTLHVCSGSVLDTPSGDLILTAAHCLADGVDAYFVPGFSDSAGDDAFWTVDAVYLDPRWVSGQDPLADYAIARVSRAAGGSVRDEAGGGFTLGSTPPRAGTEITVHGYAFGLSGDQLGCRARTEVHGDFPELQCAGLVDGTSGSPWVSGRTVTGVVGGLEGGGCAENVSYSAPFDVSVRRVLARAERGDPADVAPTVYDDDC